MRPPRLWEAIIVFIGVVLLGILVWGQIVSTIGPHRGRRISCLNNIKQLGLAMKGYSQDFDDLYPWNVGRTNPGEACRDLGMLYPEYTSAFEHFICPASTDREFSPKSALGRLGDHPLQPLYSTNSREVISYAYGIDARDPKRPTAWTESASSTVTILADKKAGVPLTKRSNHKTDGWNVLRNDGSAKFRPHRRGPLDPDEGDDTIGAPGAKDYRAWWSDPPYYGE